MKIDLILPSYRHVNSDCFNAVVALVNYTNARGHDVQLTEIYNNSYPHWARNDGLVRIRGDCEAVLFCDDDMAPLRDSLVRLIASDLPVISGLCTSRGFPVKLCITAYDEKEDLFHQIEYVDEDRVMGGKLGAGAAFLLVKREVIEAVKQQWLEAQDWLEDNRASLDRMRVSAFQREQERQRIANLRAEWLATDQRAVPVLFNLHDHETGRQLGEDVGFCRRAIQLGYPIAIDTTVQVSHVGDFPFHPMHLGIKRNKDLLIA